MRETQTGSLSVLDCIQTKKRKKRRASEMRRDRIMQNNDDKKVNGRNNLRKPIIFRRYRHAGDGGG